MLRLIVCIASIAQCGSLYSQETFNADVINISDGDTITVKRANGDEVKVRFGGIDTPEIAQRHGVAARDFLSNLIKDKSVRVELTGKRSFSRMIGEVFIEQSNGDVDVSLELVKSGHAWWFWQFADESTPQRAKKLATAEIEAKLNKRGLFAAGDPIYPRVFRRGGRTPNERLDQDSDVGDNDLSNEVIITSLIPNPTGPDTGNEKVTIKNGTSTTVSLVGWSLSDDDGGSFTLSGNLDAGASKTVTLTSTLKLGNSGDRVSLIDVDGHVVQVVSYDSVESGEEVKP